MLTKSLIASGVSYITLWGSYSYFRRDVTMNMKHKNGPCFIKNRQIIPINEYKCENGENGENMYDGVIYIPHGMTVYYHHGYFSVNKYNLIVQYTLTNLIYMCIIIIIIALFYINI